MSHCITRGSKYILIIVVHQPVHYLWLHRCESTPQVEIIYSYSAVLYIRVDVFVYIHVQLHVYSNKESDPEKYVLKLKVHRAGVKRCQYSRDGTKVISCSHDCGVKVYKYNYTHMHN